MNKVILRRTETLANHPDVYIALRLGLQVDTHDHLDAYHTRHGPSHVGSVVAWRGRLLAY
jgi:hypothetical protein